MAGGHTALHIACHEGHCNIIKELIDCGADKDKVVSYTLLIPFPPLHLLPPPPLQPLRLSLKVGTGVKIYVVRGENSPIDYESRNICAWYDAYNVLKSRLSGIYGILGLDQ